MKKKLLLCLFPLLLFGKYLLCQEQFKIERLGTDYNGIIEVDNRIIAYGNFGVLTYSDDYGEHWSQINLGEFIDILKIIKDKNNTLYALTQKGILLSKNNGLNWTQKISLEEIEIKDIALAEDKLILLGTNKVYYTDKEMTTPLNILIEFDDFTLFSKCALVENFLFMIESNYYIFRLNLSTLAVDTIDLYKIGKVYNRIFPLEKIKASGQNLFVLAAYNRTSPIELEYTNIHHIVVKSTDYGNNWEVVTYKLPVTTEFLIEDDETISTIAPIYYGNASSGFIGISFVKVGKDSTEENFYRDSTKVWFPVYRPMGIISEALSRIKFTDIAKTRNGYIFAVANGKTILRSTDNGKSWEMLSFFFPKFTSDYTVFDTGRDTIVVLTNLFPYCFISKDKGATFLPISYDNAFQISKDLYAPRILRLVNNGFAFFGFKYNRNDSAGTRIKMYTLEFCYSSDFGKTFNQKKYHFGHLIPNDSTFFFVGQNKSNLPPFNKSAIFILGLDYNISKYNLLIVCLFDGELNLIDSTLYYPPFYGYWYASAWHNGNNYFPDSSYIFICDENFRNPRHYTEVPDSLDPLYYRSIIRDNIFFSYVKQESPTNKTIKLVKFNIPTKTFEAIPVPNYIMNVFPVGDSVYVICGDTIMIFPDIASQFENYYILERNSIISDESAFINSVQFENGDTYFLLQKYIASDFFTNIYKLDLAKLSSSVGSLPVEPTINEDYTYLYAFPPYPNPSRDNVKIKIFWDSPSGDKSVYVDVFDPLGRKYKLETQFTYLTGNSAYVQINTTPLPLGVYYLQISYGSRKFVFPLSIMK